VAGLRHRDLHAGGVVLCSFNELMTARPESALPTVSESTFSGKSSEPVQNGATSFRSELPGSPASLATRCKSSASASHQYQPTRRPSLMTGLTPSHQPAQTRNTLFRRGFRGRFLQQPPQAHVNHKLPWLVLCFLSSCFGWIFSHPIFTFRQESTPTPRGIGKTCPGDFLFTRDAAKKIME
jgi:hypothetical protein